MDFKLILGHREDIFQFESSLKEVLEFCLETPLFLLLIDIKNIGMKFGK